MAALSGAFIIGLTMCTATASGASGGSKSPIVVGGVAQLADYSGIADGFNARIAQFNKAGGVEGHKIQFLGVQDDGGSPTTDQSVVQQLVEEDHVDVVAPIASEVFSSSGSTFLTQHKVPFFGWAVAPNWCNESYAFSADGCLILTNGQVSLATGGALATYLKSIGKKAAGTTVAIVNGDIPTAAASGAYEAGLFEAAGFKIVFNKGIVPINGASINYTPYVQQIEASNPGVVFLSLDFASATGLSAAFSAAGYKGILYSPVGYSEGLLQAGAQRQGCPAGGGRGLGVSCGGGQQCGGGGDSARAQGHRQVRTARLGGCDRILRRRHARPDAAERGEEGQAADRCGDYRGRQQRIHL